MKQLFLSAIIFFIHFVAISQTDKFHNTFVENFADSTSDYFRYVSTGNKSGFKYLLAVVATACFSKRMAFDWE